MALRAVFEDAVGLAWTLRRKPLESFMLPAAALGRDVLLCRDGSLVSLCRIDGARTIMGAGQLDRFVELAAYRLNNGFSEPGHALHVVLERAPDEADLLVESVNDRQRLQGERLGLELEDLLAERSRHLAGLLAAETLIAAAWTRPSALTAQQERRDRRRLRARLAGWPADIRDSQCPLAVHDALVPRHEAFLAVIDGVLTESGLVAARLDAGSALGHMRRLVNGPRSTAPDWRPATAADDTPARITDPPEDGACPPPLAPQILAVDPARQPGGLAIGERRYGALDMTLGPRRARPFAELMERLGAAGLPFRFSMLVEGGALSGLDAQLSRIAASFLAFSSDDSRLVRNAMRDLEEFRADARAVVRLRVGLLTWTASDAGERALAERLSRLQQLAEGWGETVFSALVGDPLEAFAASVPGFCCGGTAQAAAVPLAEALRLMPVDRPAPLTSARANHLFRSRDGRMLPFSFEEDDDFGFELIYGVPGRGKSVLLNSLGLAFSLQGSRPQLPFNAVIDIGPSSAGLVSLVREALPPARRAEAGWFRLRMTRDCAINPCDTQLGCREPLSTERAFLENLLGLMLTPAGADGVPDGMRELIGPTVARAYEMRSDAVADGEPRVHSPGIDAAVDRALAESGAYLPADALWWEVVDILFAAGLPDAAARAQRHAVPLLGDLVAAVREPRIQALVGDVRLGAGSETVTQAFTRILSSLAASWPVMFAPTAFDIGSVRMVAIDLGDVAPRGSAEADRQTAAFYMLARHALTRHWWIGEEMLPEIPERYRGWHEARLRIIRETPKRLCFDEFHRTGGAPAVRAQVERDVREARKLRVQLALSSQRLEDFGPSLVELANRYWLLGAGGKVREIETLSEVFALSDVLADAISYELTGPGPGGAPALLIASRRGGRFEQLVYNVPGPVELWALTTSPRDVALRDRLYGRLPPAAARAVLARHFPSGTAGERIDAELRRHELRGGRNAASESDVLDLLAENLAAATFAA